MKIYCLSIVFFFITLTQLYAQDQRVFKKGIYTSWQELVTDTPKYPLPTSITYKKVRTYNILDEIHRIAVVEISKEKADQIGAVLAFSNGKELFINDKKTNLSKASYFTIVEIHGEQFGIFNDLFSVGVNKKVGIGEFPMYCKISGTKILDFANQSITSIKNKKQLRQYIASDQELLEEFENEEDKKTVTKLYLIQYLLRKNKKI